MSLEQLTYVKTLFQALLLALLVPFIVYEVWRRRGHRVGAMVLEQASAI